MCWLHTAAASAASGPYQMRANIAAERDPGAELKTAAEMLLQRGRAFAGPLLTDVSLGPPREGRPSLCGRPGYRLPSEPEADQGNGELVEGLEDVGPALVRGSRLSATIQAFSSSVQRRRRPTPVITSSRRKPSSLVPVVVPGVRIGAGPDRAASALHPRPRQPTRKVPLRRRLWTIGDRRDPTRAAGRP